MFFSKAVPAMLIHCRSLERLGGALEVLVLGRVWRLFSAKVENSVCLGLPFYFHSSTESVGETVSQGEDRISKQGRSHCTSLLTLPRTNSH